MSPMADAAAERLRVALAVVLGGTTMFLVLSLLTTTASVPSAVALAAVAATVAALVERHGSWVTPADSPTGLPLHEPDAVPELRAGRVTDSPRHPLRPRAPGLA